MDTDIITLDDLGKKYQDGWGTIPEVEKDIIRGRMLDMDWLVRKIYIKQLGIPIKRLWYEVEVEIFKPDIPIGQAIEAVTDAIATLDLDEDGVLVHKSRFINNVTEDLLYELKFLA